MYDRTTESWWQQFVGEAIVGEATGQRLAMLPARLESFAAFEERAPDGKVLVAGRRRAPSLWQQSLRRLRQLARAVPLPRAPAHGLAPLARVVRVGDQAWALDLVARRGRSTTGDIRARLGAGPSLGARSDISPRASTSATSGSRGRTAAGWEDAVYSVDFAFAFHAFYPGSEIIVD